MLKDFRYALRTLRQNPGFALTAILSIALASGANSAIFSFVDALALRPLAVEDPSAVVSLRSVTPTQSASAMADTTAELSYPDFIDFRDESRSFEGMIAYDLRGVGFSRDRESQTQMKMGYTVSGNFFDVLGLRAAVGRTFNEEEDQVPGLNPVVVLAHSLWKQELDPIHRSSDVVCG